MVPEPVRYMRQYTRGEFWNSRPAYWALSRPIRSAAYSAAWTAYSLMVGSELQISGGSSL